VDIEQLRPELTRLSALLDPDDEIISYLQAITHFALLEVPLCVGVSITLVEDGVPYTVTATAPEVAVVDATQYLDSGPCVTAVSMEDPALEVPDVLDERRWQLFAQVAAAKGVRSSLSLPILFEGATVGALNLYGSTPDAFDDRAHMLAEMVSGHAAMAIKNADLSLRTASDAAATAAATESASPAVVEQALGVLMQLKQISPDEARRQLEDAATRARIDVIRLAEGLVALAES
jgi:GAF domain-containing protein